MSKRKSTWFEESPQKQTNSEKEDESVGEIGIVESITLKNFMCHSLLGPFTFGSNVNFVVGNNGSGKSAVLTALIVALGGNAQATNRGSSLKGFVKEGESSADVSIILRNKGKDAYKPELYGQTITVDVRINREGLRTYKLKNTSGQPVSAKRDDLVAILDHFNIQVNNPVTILTQEMSKNFLHSKGEGDKYKFFLKATQLEKIREAYTHIKQTKDVTRNSVESLEETVRELKRKYQEKKVQYESLASLDEMQTKMEELQNQMAWALVTEMEREVKPLRERLEMDERSTVKYDQKVAEWKAKLKEAERKYKQILDQLEAITVQVEQLQPQCVQLKAEAQTKNQSYKAAEAGVHRHKTNLNYLEKDKEQLSRRINEIKLIISQTTGAESQVRVDRIQKLQADLDDLNLQISTWEQQINQYQQAVARARDTLGKMRRDEQTMSVSLNANLRNLRTMESSRSDRLRRFGEQMPGLLSAIEDAHRRGRFNHKPRGPLGYCISLKNPEHALAVEVCLKAHLLAFTCDNYEDERVLQGLMSRAFPRNRPSIITSPFLPHRHDTSRREVNHPKHPSVLQALDIEDPVVANCLIDQRGIESILLIMNRKEARGLMQGRNPPRNCSQAFSKDGDQIYTDRSYSADQTRPKFLSGDVEEEIRHLQQEMDSQRTNMGNQKQQMKLVEDDMNRNEVLRKQTDEERMRAKERFRRLQLEMSDLQNVEEPQSEDLNPLEEELQDIINKMASARAESEEDRTKMADLKAAWEEAEQTYRQHKDRISAVADKADPIKEELSNTDQEVEKSKHHKKHYVDKRKSHLHGIQGLKATVLSKEQELTTSVAKATEICPERLDVRRTAKSLDSEMSRLKLKLNMQREQEGNREDIIREYHEATENYKSLVQRRNNLYRFIELLESIMHERQKVYTEMRMYLSVRCKYYFDSMLSQRGYTGEMTFNHMTETLSLSVQPGAGDTAMSDMHSLSGGERSFSTVCFLLSLWAITEAPFRCLDEFDVYMDMINRRISMDMMLKVAYSQRYRQFILLTPQSMSSLPVNPLIRILRLNDPDRSQRTLPFSQRNQEEEEE